MAEAPKLPGVRATLRELISPVEREVRSFFGDADNADPTAPSSLERAHDALPPAQPTPNVLHDQAQPNRDGRLPTTGPEAPWVVTAEPEGAGGLPPGVRWLLGLFFPEFFEDKKPPPDPKFAAYLNALTDLDNRRERGLISEEDVAIAHRALEEEAGIPPGPRDEGALVYILIFVFMILAYVGLVGVAALAMVAMVGFGRPVPAWWFAFSVVLAAGAGLARPALEIIEDLPQSRTWARRLLMAFSHLPPKSPIWLPLIILVILLIAPRVALS
jgi:hypothetical protein